MLADSADGLDLRVLGEFQQEWRTDLLAPGAHGVTLLRDGEPLVRRAVKPGQ